MYNWIPAELHCHTCNSDGSFTVPSLMEAGRDYKLDIIALTDHNTASGCYQITPELQRKYVKVIPGIEWTTFFGHMVVLNAQKYVDWRFAAADNIDEKLKEVKEAGSLAGVAHPFRVGSPMCTGCFWDFNVHAWELVDYLEVWSELNPSLERTNLQAIDMWTNLLDCGYHIACTYGKDWHSLDGGKRPDAATYLGLFSGEEVTTQSALAAIKGGRTFVTMAPVLDWGLVCEGEHFCPGSTAPNGSSAASAEITMQSRREVWGVHDIRFEKFRLIGTGGVTLAETPLPEQVFDNPVSISFEVDTASLTWVRAEILGSINGSSCTLAITSPIYFK